MTSPPPVATRHPVPEGPLPKQQGHHRAGHLPSAANPGNATAPPPSPVATAASPTNSKPWSTQEYRNPSTQVDRHMKPPAPSVQEHRNTCAQAHRNMESPAYVFSGPWGQGNISTQVPKNRRIPTLVNTSASGHSHTGLREHGLSSTGTHRTTGTRAHGNTTAGIQ